MVENTEAVADDVTTNASVDHSMKGVKIGEQTKPLASEPGLGSADALNSIDADVDLELKFDSGSSDPGVSFASEMGDSDDTEAADEEDGTTSPLPFGKMPLEVSVELGRFYIDANKSDSLDVGDIVKLSSCTPGQVRLVCNEHEVGRGELVEVNGKLAVQIVRNWSA